MASKTCTCASGDQLSLKALPGLRWFDFLSANSSAILKTQHAQTLLGQLWLLLNPLILALIYYVLILILARRGEPSVDYFIYLVSGVLLFNFASSAVSSAATSVTSGGSFILNQRFPHVLLPLSAVAAALRRFIPAVLLLMVFHFAVYGLPELSLLIAIPAFFLAAIIVTGFSLIAAAANVFFRDVAVAVPLIMRVLLYASPVLYLPEMVPDNLLIFVEWNPFYWPVAAWGGSFSQPVAVSPSSWLISSVWAAALLALGVIAFNRFRNSFATRL